MTLKGLRRKSGMQEGVQLVRSRRWTFRLAIGLVLVVVIVLAMAEWIAPYDPVEVKTREKFLPPSRTHLFGTNDLGQDVFSRVLFGARISLSVTFSIIVLGGLFGSTLGLIAGYFGGRTEFIIMRITDMFFAFPAFILAMAIAAVLGASLTNLVIAISIVWWPSYCRLVRSEALRIRVQPYVEAAIAVGASAPHIIIRHILPNSFRTILVKATTDVAYTLLTASGLNFVGLGARPPTPELGSMVAKARPYIVQFPWWAAFAGLAIFLLASIFAFLGDAWEDRISLGR